MGARLPITKEDIQSLSILSEHDAMTDAVDLSIFNSMGHKIVRESNLELEKMKKNERYYRDLKNPLRHKVVKNMKENAEKILQHQYYINYFANKAPKCTRAYGHYKTYQDLIACKKRKQKYIETFVFPHMQAKLAILESANLLHHESIYKIIQKKLKSIQKKFKGFRDSEKLIRLKYRKNKTKQKKILSKLQKDIEIFENNIFAKNKNHLSGDEFSKAIKEAFIDKKAALRKLKLKHIGIIGRISGLDKKDINSYRQLRETIVDNQENLNEYFSMMGIDALQEGAPFKGFVCRISSTMKCNEHIDTGMYWGANIGTMLIPGAALLTAGKLAMATKGILLMSDAKKVQNLAKILTTTKQTKAGLLLGEVGIMGVHTSLLKKEISKCEKIRQRAQSMFRLAKGERSQFEQCLKTLANIKSSYALTIGLGAATSVFAINKLKKLADGLKIGQLKAHAAAPKKILLPPEKKLTPLAGSQKLANIDGSHSGTYTGVSHHGRYSATTDIGSQSKYKVNQDGFLVYNDETRFVALSSDGIGGLGGGQMATSTIIDHVGKELKAGKSLQTAIFTSQMALTGFFKKYFNKETKGIGAAVAGFEVSNRGIVTFSHLGDVKGLVIRKNTIAFETRDHSLVNHLVDKKQITQQEAMTDHRRNVINKAVLVSGQYTPSVTSLQLKRNDRVILASDGLFDILHPAQVNAILTNVESAARATEILRKAVDQKIKKLRIKGDNINIIVYDHLPSAT